MIVNEIVDLKGFKGKGDGALARNWLQAATRQLQEVHDAMRQLKRETTAVRGHQFYLEVASVTRQQRKTLRWRMRDGKHVNWPIIQGLLQLMPASMASWYRDTQLRALWLNANQLAAHANWRGAETFMETLRTAIREADDR